MKGYLRANGSPSSLTTPARMNATAGAKHLIDLFAEEDFADMVIITLDWVGDGITPAMQIDCVKWFPQYGGRYLKTNQIISIDDAFGMDNFDNALSVQIVHDLKEEFERKSHTRPPGME